MRCRKVFVEADDHFKVLKHMSLGFNIGNHILRCIDLKLVIYSFKPQTSVLAIKPSEKIVTISVMHPNYRYFAYLSSYFWSLLTTEWDFSKQPIKITLTIKNVASVKWLVNV